MREQKQGAAKWSHFDYASINSPSMPQSPVLRAEGCPGPAGGRRGLRWIVRKSLAAGVWARRLARAAEPQEGILEEQVLGGIVKDSIAVSHVHIDHLVAGIGPNHGQIASDERVLQPQGIIGG